MSSSPSALLNNNATMPSNALSLVDPEMYNFIENEKVRQCTSINLLPAENFTSVAVVEALASISCRQRYGKKSYGAISVIDLCASRAIDAFNLNPSIWGVNVRPYSSSSANFAVYTALLQPQDCIMGLNMPLSDHFTNENSSEKNISAISVLFHCVPYTVNPANGLIDYDELEKNATSFSPKLITCGGSAYSRDWDYKRLKEIAKRCGAWLLCDMSDVIGFVLTKEVPVNPFEYCDVVTTTTHTSLRGPQSAMIFYRKDAKFQNELFDLENKINKAVFPTLQDGPRENQIASLAVALEQAKLPQFVLYIQQVKKNVVALEKYLINKGYKMLTRGADNFLLVWDLGSLELTGNFFEKVCDMCNITLKEHAIIGDNMLASSGVCLGALAMTSRGLIEEQFEKIGEFLHEAIGIGREVQKKHGMLLESFSEDLVNNRDIEKLKNDVIDFVSVFDIPGFH